MRALLVIVLVIVLSTWVTATEAACIDVVVPGELPVAITTDQGIDISYSYYLEKEEYSVSLRRGDVEIGTFGPFILNRGCKPAMFAGESREYLILENGCGTFCWYFKIFSLVPRATTVNKPYRKVNRPLRFDSKRNLLAYYQSKVLIQIMNLNTGYVQDIKTAFVCESYSGLCFTDVHIGDSTLEYTWIYNPQGKRLSVALESGLLMK